MLASFLRCRRCSVQNPWNTTFSITPLLFDASSPMNPREYPHKPYIARNYCHCATSLLLTIWVYLYWNFCGGLRKPIYFETECEMAVQGHPRSLISVPIESTFTTFSILPCFRDITGFLFRTATPPLFHLNFRGVLLVLDHRCCGSKKRSPKLIICVIN